MKTSPFEILLRIVIESKSELACEKFFYTAFTRIYYLAFSEIMHRH